MSASNTTAAKGRLLTALSVVILFAVVGVFGQGAAHAAANPLLSNQASASGLPVGTQIYDSATLGYAVNPTGSLTFKLFGPEDPNCAGTPLFTTTTTVNGNNYYESSRYYTLSAGTYQWIAAYSGDANNHPSAPTSCNDPAGEVSVAKRMPNLTASPSWVAPTASATATLTMGAGPSGPTGTMTHKLYGPDNMTCAGAPIFVSSKAVNGNGWYSSASYNPTASGTYQWVIHYSGDANNVARSSICSDTSNGFTVAPANPALVSGSPSTVARGATITVTWSAVTAPTTGDWMAIYKAGTADGGAVTAWKYTGGAGAGSTTMLFPWGATEGNYEIRVMANNSIQRLATSAPIVMDW